MLAKMSFVIFCHAEKPSSEAAITALLSAVIDLQRKSRRKSLGNISGQQLLCVFQDCFNGFCSLPYKRI